MVITCTTLIDNDCLPWNTFPARTKIINIELRGIKTVNYMREGLTILINMSTRNFWNIERVGFFGRGRDTADCDNIVFELNMGCLPRPLGDFSCRIGNPRQPGRFLQCKKTQIRHRICVPLLKDDFNGKINTCLPRGSRLFVEMTGFIIERFEPWPHFWFVQIQLVSIIGNINNGLKNLSKNDLLIYACLLHYLAYILLTFCILVVLAPDEHSTSLEGCNR